MYVPSGDGLREGSPVKYLVRIFSLPLLISSLIKSSSGRPTSSYFFILVVPIPNVEPAPPEYSLIKEESCPSWRLVYKPKRVLSKVSSVLLAKIPRISVSYFLPCVASAIAPAILDKKPSPSFPRLGSYLWAS